MIVITPAPGQDGGLAAQLLAAADSPEQVRTVTSATGVAFEVPESLAVNAGLLDADGQSTTEEPTEELTEEPTKPPPAPKPKRAPRKTAAKTTTTPAGEADTNT